MSDTYDHTSRKTKRAQNILQVARGDRDETFQTLFLQKLPDLIGDDRWVDSDIIGVDTAGFFASTSWAVFG
jgi:hypothetical protein